MGKKSPFHISDEFNGNGQKVYLKATTHRKYEPLSQKNVRLTSNYRQCLQKVAGALPLLMNPNQKNIGMMLKAAGAMAGMGQVIIKKDASGKYQMTYHIARKISSQMDLICMRAGIAGGGNRWIKMKIITEQTLE